MNPLQLRYLLVISIPVYRDRAGMRYVDPLWHKDLLLHLEYIEDFSLACPCFELGTEVPAGLMKLDEPRIRFIELPSRLKGSLRMPQMAWRLWRAIGQADLVHSGVGGWYPGSIGNLTAAMARLRKRFLLIIVESSPWRIHPGQRPGMLARLRAWCSERMNRLCVGMADLAVFTQREYKSSLLSPQDRRGHVIQASWIDEAVFASAAELDAARARLPCGSGDPLRLLFAGRLTRAKGLEPLLQAIGLARSAGLPIQLDVLGEGELQQWVDDAANASTGAVQVRRLGSVAYGPVFFALLRDYHALVVPSLSDEQPRIVYDASSQGVPVLASDTPGLRECVIDRQTGRLFRPNDPAALFDVLQTVAADKASLRPLGDAGMAAARLLTHREMHRRRWQLLEQALATRNVSGSLPGTNRRVA